MEPKSNALPFSSTFTPATSMAGMLERSSEPEASGSPADSGSTADAVPSKSGSESPACASSGPSSAAIERSVASLVDAAATAAIRPVRGNPQSLQNFAPSLFSD